MKYFYEYNTLTPQLNVELDIKWSKLGIEKSDVITNDRFLLHRIDQLKPFEAKFTVKADGWRQIVPPPEAKGKKQFIDVYVFIEASGSRQQEKIKLIKKNQVWKGSFKFNNPKVFLSNCSIHASITRNQKSTYAGAGTFGKGIEQILGESDKKFLDFVEGDFAGGEIEPVWIDFEKLQNPFKQSDQLFGVDITAKKIKLYLNSDDKNAHIEKLTEDKRRKNFKSTLHILYASQSCQAVLTAVLVDLREICRKSPDETDEDKIQRLSDRDRKILNTFIFRLYPEIETGKEDCQKKLIEHCQKGNSYDFRALITTRTMLAVQDYIGLVKKIRAFSKDVLRTKK